MVSISVIISIITTAALVASVVIYCMQYKEMSKQNETLKQQIEEMKKQTDSLQEQIRIMKVKPKLDVEFEYSIIDKPVGEAKLIRIKVSNNGDTAARECIAKAEIIRNSVPETFGGVLLHWIRYWEGVYTDIKDQFRPLDIAKGDYEIADLVVIGKTTLKFSRINNTYSVIRCNRNPTLEPIDSRARVRAEDIIRVNVYCDNITSKPICLEALKDPDYDVVNDNNVGDFFKEIECPKL
ncbi:MAG: hypothetical protein RXR08_14465 [Sulfolobaceae archaeon]